MCAILRLAGTCTVSLDPRATEALPHFLFHFHSSSSYQLRFNPRTARHRFHREYRETEPAPALIPTSLGHHRHFPHVACLHATTAQSLPFSICPDLAK
jgi:hypothetical protein